MKDLIGAVEKHRSLILETERYVWKNPETGYKEVKTSKYLENIFRDLGYELNMAEQTRPGERGHFPPFLMITPWGGCARYSRSAAQMETNTFVS